jgi:hypothetical protein
MKMSVFSDGFTRDSRSMSQLRQPSSSRSPSNCFSKLVRPVSTSVRAISPSPGR